ncbi:MAG: hypothetical protein NZ740_09235, partial [Kiritimatiellae bacterium]|nr:hypothetical protein [Kiritimatiellia bacterium]MDW8459276.1 hypothetical protein [Verrucomicrobiota bacterium]
MKRIFPRKALSLAALVWCSATASIHAQIYESLFTNLYYSLFLTNTLRLYVPEECGPTGVMGVLMFFNGSGEDRRFMTQIPWVQNFARTHRFAVMATDGNWELDNHNRAQFFQDLTNILRLAEAISGRTNLLNAPYMFMGHSFGAFSANYVGLEASDRTIGYVAHKAHYWDYEYYRTPSYTGIWSHLPLATNIAGRYVIGAFVPGERDGNGAANPWRVQHEAYQYLLMDGGQVSFAIDYDTGHDDTLNQGHDFGFSVMSEAIRLRHPGFVPATGYTPLAWLPITNGWLVDRVLLSSNPSPVNPNSTIVVRPSWPTMTNFSAYTAPLTNASWLPSRGAARAYRAFTSTQPTYQKRVPAPKQNPLVIETPVRFQRFRAGDAVRVVADTREWTAAKRMTLFVNDVEIGTLTNRPWVWTVPNISTGAHTLVVEASDEQGTNYAAFVFITADGPLTRTNRWTGGATNNHFGAAANWS